MKELFKKVVVAILTAEAKLLLRRTKPTIIGVTGSVGKTSAKDAIYAAIKNQVHTRKNEKSFNSEIGVPLTVLGLRNGWSSPYLWIRNIIDGAIAAFFVRSYPKVLVLEMGVDQPGDMKQLCSWVRPDIVVLTRFPDVPVHVEAFKSPERVIAEKTELLKALKPDGVVIYNQDDEKIVQVVEKTLQKSVGFSRYSPSDFTAKGEEIMYQHGKPVGLSFKVEHGEEKVEVTLHGVLGVPQLYTVAAALAVADQFGVPLNEAVEALENTQHTPGRMSLVSGRNDTTIIDDTYNSSPVAAEHALITLKKIKTDGRKIAVLGDMLELGKFSSKAHETVGEEVPESADMLITIGLRARKIAEAALENGMSSKVVWQYDDVSRAMAELPNRLEPGDVVLVKASQGVRAEKLVKAIMKNPEQAEELLVRQDPAWQDR